MHESGHAMYEQGIGSNLARTPLAHGASAGVHESQSRLWENLVGRSRPFQEYLFPRLQQAFPSQLGNTDIETFYRAINKVHPSFIRVEADEVTYNLHIMLRFEIEKEILAGSINIAHLDDIWNERMREYLGITPPNSSEGVLQDIHWSWADTFGLFPGYALGNVIGTQLSPRRAKPSPTSTARWQKATSQTSSPGSRPTSTSMAASSPLTNCSSASPAAPSPQTRGLST